MAEAPARQTPSGNGREQSAQKHMKDVRLMTIDERCNVEYWQKVSLVRLPHGLLNVTEQNTLHSFMRALQSRDITLEYLRAQVG
eukprot:1157179-Pelagomonas_calceolata.AAC.8